MPPTTYTIWICRCTNGHFWPEHPGHVMCIDCGHAIRRVLVVTIGDAINYSPSSLAAALAAATPSRGDSDSEGRT